MGHILDRINELSRLSRQRELSEAENQEQKYLRERYLANFRRNVKAQLDNIYIVDENGNEQKLQKRNQ